jgi:hypothetical protein
MDYARETPLDVCPDPVCRRSGLCHAIHADARCRKFYMTGDEWHQHFAETLENLWIEFGGDPADLDKPCPEPSPEAWADFYNAMREREAEYDAAQKAEAQPKRRRSGRARGRSQEVPIRNCESARAPLNRQPNEPPQRHPHHPRTRQGSRPQAR